MLMLSHDQGFHQEPTKSSGRSLFRAFGDELFGRTLGLIGLGASGRELARLSQPLGLPIVGDRRRPPLPTRPGAWVSMSSGEPEKLNDLLSMADVVSIHVPLTPATQGMIGPAALERMKPSAILINVSRGQIVDQVALLDATSLAADRRCRPRRFRCRTATPG